LLTKGEATNICPIEQETVGTVQTREAQSFLTGRGGLYLCARYGLGVLISLSNMFMLTWLLGPHIYGVFVTAIGLTSVLASLVRSGLDTYLVRCERTPSRHDYDTACTAILCFSAAAMFVGTALIPLLMRWLHSREFVSAYLVTMLTIPIVGLAGPVTAKLERALQFRVVAQIELFGQVLALTTGLGLALRQKGIWAPVAGQLVWQTFALLAAFRAARYFPRLDLDRERLREMLAFGVGYTASQRTWQLRALVNPLIVGRFVGAEGVAFVGLAIRIAEGLGFLRLAASRLAVASLSRLQHDANLLRSSLQKALRGQVVILGPLLDAFAIASPFVIHHFLTDRWAPVQHIYPLVALAVLINSIYNLQAAALFVAGRHWIVLRAYACHVALFATGAFVLVPRTGFLGYGLADLLACAAYPLLQIRTSKTIGAMPHTLWMWVLVFGLPLFAPYVRGVWSMGLCAVAVLLAALVWRMERSTARANVAVPVSEMNRVLVRG
jgi:PST family polysaccharide transporter